MLIHNIGYRILPVIGRYIESNVIVFRNGKFIKLFNCCSNKHNVDILEVQPVKIGKCVHHLPFFSILKISALQYYHTFRISLTQKQKERNP